MKKFLIALISISMFSLLGCAPTVESMKQDMANEYASGAHDQELIDTVAFDTDCKKENIKIVSRKDSAGFGQYKIDACGTKLKYKRSGSVFQAAK